MTPRTPKVLVVDEDADVRSVVEDLIFDQGFEVRQAPSADAAVLELRKGTFDVVLCHLRLLRSERVHLSQRLRELEPPPPPVLSRHPSPGIPAGGKRQPFDLPEELVVEETQGSASSVRFS